MSLNFNLKCSNKQNAKILSIVFLMCFTAACLTFKGNEEAINRKAKAVSVSDRDHDGILDKDDLCPEHSEDKDLFEDQDGCPDLDNDKDRIPDRLDKCPNQPENYNGVDDEDGCPDRCKMIIHKNIFRILDTIYFKKNRATINPISKPILASIAHTIKQHPELKRIEIAGHADDPGSEFHNNRLSLKRAEAVKAFFVKRGIEATRLVVRGYGRKKQVINAKSEEERKRNRRVGFEILEKTESKPE